MCGLYFTLLLWDIVTMFVCTFHILITYLLIFLTKSFLRICKSCTLREWSSHPVDPSLTKHFLNSRWGCRVTRFELWLFALHLTFLTAVSMLRSHWTESSASVPHGRTDRHNWRCCHKAAEKMLHFYSILGLLQRLSNLIALMSICKFT